MPRTMAADYSTVTELPGGRASAAQIARLLERYQLAARHAAGRDVLEVGCGAGLGLGWLAREAGFAVGGDYTAGNLRLARRHYQQRIALLRFDAAELPFRGGSFDLIVMFETLYYLARPHAFVDECRRLLRPGGMVLIGAVNPQRRGFHPSPFAACYFTADELRALLARGGFNVQMLGGFPDADSAAAGIFSWLKRAASRAGVIPKTMHGKEILKRMLFGPLEVIPAEIMPCEKTQPRDQSDRPSAPGANCGLATAGPPALSERNSAGPLDAGPLAGCSLTPIHGPGPHPGYAVLYALGRLEQPSR